MRRDHHWECNLGDWVDPDYFAPGRSMWAIGVYPVTHQRVLFMRYNKTGLWVRKV